MPRLIPTPLPYSLNASGDDTLKDNKSRDLQEKIFHVWKNETDNNRIRVSSDPSARGKIFFAFLSVLLHKALENIMNQTGMLKKYTVSSLLDECKKY